MPNLITDTGWTIDLDRVLENGFISSDENQGQNPA